jgi:hypothetical protein
MAKQESDAVPVPHTSDGKEIVLPALFPGDVSLNYCGQGDSANLGDGQAFEASSVTPGDTVVEFQFRDWVYLGGGDVTFGGAKLGDWITFEFYAPATPITSTPGVGNANLVGGVKLIPALNNDGSHTVDMTTATPVPSASDPPTGYYSWNGPDTGKGTLTAVDGGVAPFDLYIVPIVLHRFATRLRILGNGVLDLKVAAVKPKKLLPHWKGKITLHTTVASLVEVVWTLMIARKKTA